MLPAKPAPRRREVDPALRQIIDGLCEELRGHVDRVLSEAEKSGLREDEWARSFELMLTRDGIPPHQITTMIRWVSADRFWARNIRSARKLRQKWARLAGEPGYQAALHQRRPARPAASTRERPGGPGVNVITTQC